jgi:hypothetical protein
MNFFKCLAQQWPTQTGLYAATWKICQKYRPFGPQYDKNWENTPKTSKNRLFSIRTWNKTSTMNRNI